MALWKRIFDRGSQPEVITRFKPGRFSDAHKPQENYKSWNESMICFEIEDYRDSITHFLEYLREGDGTNIDVVSHHKHLKFSIKQGSNTIFGRMTGDRMFAFAVLVEAHEYSDVLLGRLLEKNYHLDFCRYALDDKNRLVLVFDSYVQDANPYKLYFGLKELAIHADKMDDLILSEFHLNESNGTPASGSTENRVAKIKSDFFYRKLRKLKYDIDEGYLSEVNDNAAVIYAVLSVFYKLDYLLTPHGHSVEIIECAHKSYYADQTLAVEQRLAHLIDALDQLLHIPPEKLRSEWYDVTYTFGITPPIDLYMFKPKVSGDLGRIDWYISQNRFDEAGSIIEYVIGYLFFDYSLDPLLNDLLAMYYRISEASLYSEMGEENRLLSKTGKLNSGNIKKAFEKIIEAHEDHYDNTRIKLDVLKFGSIYHFGQSLLHMLSNSSFTTKISFR